MDKEKIKLEMADDSMKWEEKEISYTPSPVDTSSVIISPLMQKIINGLAELAHEDWRKERLLEGGTIEQYPNLKPWNELSSVEKSSAFKQAEETVKLIEMKFGVENVIRNGDIPDKEIVDTIAKNAHEVWAKQRMDDGWPYASVRDNEKKHHPMLIPFDMVPESEKAYDEAYGRLFIKFINTRIEVIQGSVEIKTQEQANEKSLREKEQMNESFNPIIDSIPVPENTKQVGNIELSDSVTLSLPERTIPPTSIYPNDVVLAGSESKLSGLTREERRKALREKERTHFDNIKLRNPENKTSEEYRLATDISMFMAQKLNEYGIKTVVVSEEKAKEALERERALAGQGRSGVEFSMRDIMNLSYTWNGEEVSMRGFAEQFMSEIKQKDRTMEDAERIAKTFIEAVKADPEKAGMKMLKAENMANAFRFKLPDGTIYTPEHPMAASPEYETQKGLWEIYEHVLGKETMREFIGLLSKNAPMSSEERKRYSELESKVNGSDVMQSRLEVPASKVNENRVRDIRNLIQYFEGNDDYTWTEKALIVKGAMSFGYSEKKEADSTRVEIKNISDNNSVSVPVIGGEAAAVVEGLRKGLNFKDALVQARIMLSKESKRSVGSNFTGWKVYKQSDKEEDAVILNQDVAGTGWCTGGAVSTARSHLSGGDFHVYYEAGEPLIAIRTENGRMAEPPRGAHEGQFCTDREEQIAFDYIRSGNGIIAGYAYIADIEDIRHIMSPDATPLDAFLMPDERRYENGEFGDDTKAWGKSVEQRIAELVPDKKEERWKLGLYYGYEIEDACKNGNAIAIKGSVRNGDAIAIEDPVPLTLPKGVTKVGDIELYRSASLTLSEGVTQVGNIYLHQSASLTLPDSVTQVGRIELHHSSSLTLPAGVTQVGRIHLSDSASLNLPEGVTKVGDIELRDSASLTLPAGVMQVGRIDLYGSASLTLPDSVTQVGDIYLRGSSSLTLPDGVTQVGKIHLGASASLILPDGVTQVGKIVLVDSASLTIPEGLTQVGDIYLYENASLTLPESVTQVGKIYLDEDASLILPVGVTKVGIIELYDSASLTIPKGVTQVGDITLGGSASLTLPEGVTQVGDIFLGGSASLTLPEGVTQVGNVHLDSGASITFPDGFVLKPSLGDGSVLYSAEEMNQLLSEHQKKQEFRLADGTIYGYQQGDTIYLTPAGINPNAPIHEYAHLWAKVYERLRPDEWKELKQELKTTSLWSKIANSPSYSFIDNDENRLAGEVLATIVGNKGEELMLSAASKTLEEGKRTDRSVVKGAEYFREMVTKMAVKDVFDAEGMGHTGEVTLKVLKDFAEGKGVKIRKDEGERLAAMTGNVSDTFTHDAIVAHLDKITALYPKEPTEVTRKADGTIVRQYGEFDYEQIKGGFEISKNRVLVEDVHPDSLQRLALYTMSSDSYGEHPNGPFVIFWDNGNIRSYENCTVHLGSDDEFESDKLSFTREGILQEKIPGDYSIEPFLKNITSDYMKTMAQKEEAPKENANKADSDVLSTHLDKKQEKREALRKKDAQHYGNVNFTRPKKTKGLKIK